MSVIVNKTNLYSTVKLNTSGLIRDPEISHYLTDRWCYGNNPRLVGSQSQAKKDELNSTEIFGFLTHVEAL